MYKSPNHSLRSLIAMLACLSALLASCGDDDASDTEATGSAGEDGGSETTEADGEPFVVGALYSSGGPLKAYADAFTEGIEYFISEHPTINGRPMELAVVDDGAEPSAAVNALELLLEREAADVVLGPYLNSTTVAVLDPLNQAEVINFNQSASADATDASRNPYTFLVEWPKDAEGKAMLQWACENDATAVATMVVDNAGGSDTERSITDNIEDAPCDLELVGSQQFATGATDTLAQAEAVASADMVVLGAASPTDFAAAVSSLQEIGYEGWIASNYALGIDSTVDLLPADMSDQLVPFGATPRIVRPLEDDVQAWLDGITEFLGRPPAANAYKSYDAIMLYHTAAEAVGSFDADAIREWLESNEVCGAYGCYGYSADSHQPFPPEYNTPYAAGTEESGFVDPWSAADSDS